MKQIERRAVEFRQLQELVHVQLRALDLSAMGKLTQALTVQEFRTLEFLHLNELKMMREIAEYLGIAVNSVVEVVDGLEQKKFAVRCRDDSDRRIVRVELTKSGRTAAQAIVDGFRSMYCTYLSRLTESEQETLLALYRKIASK